MSEGNLSLIQIHRFFSKFVPARDDEQRKKGELDQIDYVEYGPIGARDRATNIARVGALAAVLESSTDNPAIAAAKARWSVIKPKYEAWKAGQALEIDGTPLAAWNAIDHEVADKLRMNGIQSIEEVAALTGVHIERLGIPNMRNLIEMAKKYEASKDTAAFTVALEEKDRQIANLMAKVDELAEAVSATSAPSPAPEPLIEPAAKPEVQPRRRGRPPKSTVSANEPADDHSIGG